ncbi:hypothetical protein AB0E69_36730 [Kribbella sp. NPDC026611]|uniref:hypothetical protein n=1 Tax=Kribbella sp. NPDC026611 TaxID=3154911 RepID=UPI003404ECC5
MRTEADLRDAFEDLADQAPHPADIHARLQRGSRRTTHRRTAVVVGTALVTATAAVAAIVVPRVISSAPQVADEEKQPSAWSNWVGLHLPKDFEITAQIHTANRQHYELLQTGSPWATLCELQVSRNGDFDPATIPSGSPAQRIADRTGRVVTSTREHPFLAAPYGVISQEPLAAVGKTLVWQPAQGLWALLSCESQQHLGTVKVPNVTAPYDANVPLATKLGAALSGGSRLGSPFVVGELPADLIARRATFGPDRRGIPGNGNSFAVVWSDGNPATGYRPTPSPKVRFDRKTGKPVTAPVVGNPAWRFQPGDDLAIRYDTSKTWDQFSRGKYLEPDGTIHGMKAFFTRDLAELGTAFTKAEADRLTRQKPVLRLEGNGVAVMIESIGDQLTQDQLRHVAETLQLTTTPNQPARWFDAATAIH